MSPIPTIFLALLLTLTTSFAQNKCHNYNSVSELLDHYGLPPSLFPNNVRHFSCHPVDKDGYEKDALLISIQLEGVCKVSRTAFDIGNVVECQPEISGIISYGHITDVTGVTVTLTFRGKPVGEPMTITEVKVDTFPFTKFKYLQFNSDKGPSPWFPLALIPNEPPSCDNTEMVNYYYGHPLIRLVA